MGRLSPASRAPSLGSCKYNISLMAIGHLPVVSTSEPSLLWLDQVGAAVQQCSTYPLLWLFLEGSGR
eukprot:4116752-Amphidinium_carterae.1